jgi:hypothetical protein
MDRRKDVPRRRAPKSYPRQIEIRSRRLYQAAPVGCDGQTSMPKGVVHNVPRDGFCRRRQSEHFWSGRSGADAGADADMPKNSQQKQSGFEDGEVKL